VVLCHRCEDARRLEPETLARRSDPTTSHEAARRLRGSPLLSRLQRSALDLVRLYPGSTANQLARLAGSDDSRTIPRRLRELERAGYAIDAGTMKDDETGRQCLRWWPRQPRREGPEPR